MNNLQLINKSKNKGLGQGMSPTVSIMNLNAIRPPKATYGHKHDIKLRNKSEDSYESDPETKELDEYLARRLERIEADKNIKKFKSWSNIDKIIEEAKKYNSSGQSKDKPRIIDEDSEYEYILESEEEEEEWLSESEDSITPVDKIFSNSFLNENNPAHSTSKQPSKRSSKLNTKNKAYSKNKSGENSWEVISKYNNKYYKNIQGNFSQLKAKRLTLINEHNKKGIEIEERKEDSYLHSGLDNSNTFSNTFSNISAIMGQQTFNNSNMLSFDGPNEDLAQELENMDDVDNIDNIEEELKELYGSEMNENKTNMFSNSLVYSISEGESKDWEMKSNVKILKNDMDKITKDLEKIRDLVMTTEDAKDLLKDIHDHHGDNGEGEDTDDYLPEYNSREISDLITDHKI